MRSNSDNVAVVLQLGRLTVLPDHQGAVHGAGCRRHFFCFGRIDLADGVFQHVLPNLDFITRVEFGVLHPFAVHGKAVGAHVVHDGDRAADALDDGVIARHAQVVQDQVGIDAAAR